MGGVEFYLFITAFLLTSKLLNVKEKEDIQVGKIILKRWKRLSPLFYLVVFLLTIYFCFQEQKIFIPDDFWSFIPFWQNFFWLINPEATKVPACFHFWYLTLDFYLFIVWAILFRLVDRSKMKLVLSCLLLFSIIYRSVCPLISDNNVILSYTMPWGMFDTFALGSLAAVNFKEDKTVFRNKAILSFVLGSVLFVLCMAFMIKLQSVGAITGVLMFSSAEYYGHHPVTIQIILAMTLFAYSAVWFCLADRKHYGVLSNASIAKLGTMSYELYVLHFPVLFFTRQYVTNIFVVAVIAITATILLSFLWDNRGKLSLNNQRTC